MSTENLISADEAQKLLNAATRPNAGCTGVSAGWCSIHGDCLCRSLPVTECPLHAADSTHAEGDATALRESAEALARTVIALHAEVARLTTVNVDLLVILEGRTTAPEDTEIEAHIVAGGAWMAVIQGHVMLAETEEEIEVIFDEIEDAWDHDCENPEDVCRWWPLDRERRPCAWPKVSG